MSRILGRLGVFLVATSLVLPLPALAQDHGRQLGTERATVPTLADALSLAWQRFVRFFTKNGSALDPNGSTGAAPPVQSGTAPSVLPANGSRLDPNGAPLL